MCLEPISVVDGKNVEKAAICPAETHIHTYGTCEIVVLNKVHDLKIRGKKEVDTGSSELNIKRA